MFFLSTVIPFSPLYPPNACVDGGYEFFTSGEINNASICDSSVRFSRIAWNKPHPNSLEFATVIAQTEHGNQSIFWRKKDITHPKGWNGLFQRGAVLNLSWKDYTQLTNITYDLSTYSLDELGDNVPIQHNFNQEPDKIRIVPGQTPMFINESLPNMPNGNSTNGEFYWNTTTYQLTYVLAHQLTQNRMSSNLSLSPILPDPREFERKSSPDIYRCYFTDCLPPPPETFPTGRPTVIYRWSEDAIWNDLNISKPVDGDDFELPGLYYLIVDEPLPQLGIIIVYDYATLELEDTMDHVINCTHILIHGGQLVAGELIGT